MRGKLLLVAGVGVGYVLGSRAGRGRYEQIAKAAGKLWNSPSVQTKVHDATDLLKDKAPDAVGSAFGTVKKVVGKNKKSNGTSLSDAAPSAPSGPSH